MKAVVLLSAVVSLTLGASAAITVPGADGSDGVLNITADTVIDLSQAVTGVWDANNTANAGKGIYDPDKWAVVFKYSSVTVAAGKTVTFKNHASRAPVVWLVSGDVAISGTVSLDGANYANAPALAEPGPGGFRGGQGYYSAGVVHSPGFGVGGGAINASSYFSDYYGGGGSYGTSGSNGQAAYGNPSVIPLIGGSAGGGRNNAAQGGGAGGGAILIACANSLAVGGAIRANGGSGSGGGSGGAIRLVTESLSGSGALNCLGGGGNNTGGLGRIRIERVNNSRPDSATTAPTPSVVPLAAADTALLWPPSGSPEVKIVSIGDQNIPADPRAEFGTTGADAVLPQTSSTQVVIETTNVEASSVLTVRGTPRSNGNYVTGTIQGAPVQVSASPLVLRWTATLPVQVGYSAVQVKVVRP